MGSVVVGCICLVNRGRIGSLGNTWRHGQRIPLPCLDLRLPQGGPPCRLPIVSCPPRTIFPFKNIRGASPICPQLGTFYPTNGWNPKSTMVDKTYHPREVVPLWSGNAASGRTQGDVREMPGR